MVVRFLHAEEGVYSVEVDGKAVVYQIPERRLAVVFAAYIDREGHSLSDTARQFVLRMCHATER